MLYGMTNVFDPAFQIGFQAMIWVVMRAYYMVIFMWHLWRLNFRDIIAIGMNRL